MLAIYSFPFSYLTRNCAQQVLRLSFYSVLVYDALAARRQPSSRNATTHFKLCDFRLFTLILAEHLSFFFYIMSNSGM